MNNEEKNDLVELMFLAVFTIEAFEQTIKAMAPEHGEEIIQTVKDHAREKRAWARVYVDSIGETKQ